MEPPSPASSRRPNQGCRGSWPCEGDYCIRGIQDEHRRDAERTGARGFNRACWWIDQPNFAVELDYRRTIRRPPSDERDAIGRVVIPAQAGIQGGQGV